MNEMANFLRNAVDLNRRALSLGLRPRVFTEHEVEQFFIAAAMEIERLERAVENRTA